MTTSSYAPICIDRRLLDTLPPKANVQGWTLRFNDGEFLFWTCDTRLAVSVTNKVEPTHVICLYHEVPPSNEVFSHEYSQAVKAWANGEPSQSWIDAEDPDKRHDQL